MENEDLKHTNKYGEIEAFKNTKYWFKRDIKTIKNSFKNTLKFSPAVFLISLVLSSIFVRIETFQFNLRLMFLYSIVLFPVFLFGYLMLHIMVTKGYDVDPYVGTHIKTDKLLDRFSVSKILSSNMPRGEKILHITRLVFYLLLCLGLLANILLSVQVKSWNN